MVDSSGSAVIVGAGPAGLTVARLLALRGRRTVLVDAGRPSHNRLELVAPSAVAQFRAAGLDHLLWDRDVAAPCLGIRRSCANREDQEDFFSKPGGAGFVVDRSALDAALLSLALNAGVERQSARLTNARLGPYGFELILVDGSRERTLFTQTVVDATGRAAALSRRLGAKRQCLQKLIAERVDSAEPFDDWLTFRPMGDATWAYSLSGPNQRSEDVADFLCSPFVANGRGRARRCLFSHFESGSGWRLDCDRRCLYLLRSDLLSGSRARCWYRNRGGGRDTELGRRFKRCSSGLRCCNSGKCRAHGALERGCLPGDAESAFRNAAGAPTKRERSD